MNASGKNNLQKGTVEYSLYDSEADVSVRFDNNFDVSHNGAPKMRFRVIGDDIYYSHWDANINDFEAINHPLTGNTTGMAPPSDFIEVSATNGIVLNADMTSLTETNGHGSSCSLVGGELIELQAGTYRIDASACVDFTNANGLLQFAFLNHATHLYLVSPDIKSTLGVCAGNHVLDYGHSSTSFIVTFATTTNICVRPIQLAHFTQLLYLNLIATRLL